ncbi:tetratricopeptide repeat protein [Streptomyces sp. NPDC057238]|uniref:tetratricopeptide repeat protein n=1 Tax=Streptomyces sp. NPDC057238 TaxID=3346060 RepID=UPI0036307A70
MEQQSDRLRAELRALYEAADRPTLSQLAKQGAKQVPPMPVSVGTVHSWLNGPAVPGPDKTACFLALVAYLHSEAAAHDSRYRPRSQAWWGQLLKRARQERDARRGGRPRTTGPPGPPATGPVTLPAAPAAFAGRTAEVEEVLLWLEPRADESREPVTVAVSAVAGMGGVGKTALALHAAHQASARGWFPGGTLFADLHGYSSQPPTEPEQVVGRLLHAMGVRGRDLPDGLDGKLDVWRYTLNTLARAGTPLLLVLDNVRSPEQITALLPQAPHRAVITSRHSLSVLPVHRLRLNPLTEEEALALIHAALSVDDRGAERVHTQRDAAAELAGLCGHLPLALRIVSALLREAPERALSEHVADLRAASSLLDVIAYEGCDEAGRPYALRASFALSYDHLPQPQSRLFRLLAEVPGDRVSTRAVAALLDGSTADARRLLHSLERSHLLIKEPADTEGPLPTEDTEYWTMHDLIRLFAREYGEEAATADRRDEALDRLRDHYADDVLAAAGHLSPKVATQAAPARFTSKEQAVSWLETERTTLLIATTTAPKKHRLFRTAGLLAVIYNEMRYFEDAVTLGEQTIEICREAGNQDTEAAAWNTLGEALQSLHRFDRAIEAHTRELAIRRETNDPAEECSALTALGTSYAGRRRFDQAAQAHRAALELARSTGDVRRRAVALNGLGLMLREIRQFDEAISCHSQAVEIYRELGNIRGEAESLNNLGLNFQDVGRFTEAVEAHTRDVALCRELEDTHSYANALSNLGLSLHAVGRYPEALEKHEQAVEMLRDQRDPRGEGGALVNLGRTLERLRRFEEALAAHHEAAQLLADAGDLVWEGRALQNAGVVLMHLARLDDAMDHQLRAIEVFDLAADRHGAAASHYNIGTFFRAKGDYEKAADSFARATALFRETGDAVHEARALLSLGIVEAVLRLIRLRRRCRWR